MDFPRTEILNDCPYSASRREILEQLDTEQIQPYPEFCLFGNQVPAIRERNENEEGTIKVQGI